MTMTLRGKFLLAFAGVGLLLTAGAATASQSNLAKSASAYHPDISYTLKTNIGPKGMGFLGVGDGIDGVNNPTLHVPVGAVVQITLINGDGAEHDIAVPEFKALSDHVITKGASTVISFRVTRNGTFDYFCTLPGHRQAGMQGKLIVGKPVAEPKSSVTDVSRDPADLPQPVGKRDPQKVTVRLYTREIKGRLDDGTTYNYWTFNGKVPGPMIRVRVGDTVELHLKNNADSRMIHSIDLHAVTGPGGGSAVMQVPPGEERSFTFKALKPGLFVYHCATPMVAEHSANGMFGMILVEPAGGLPKVDHEYYVMQNELYTTGAYGQRGDQEFDVQKLLNEQPEYFVFNGEVGALTTLHPMHAQVGETVRIYFGVGGPNFTSSFHMIGEIFDHAYEFGSLSNPPLKDIQTVLVPPGGSTIVDFKTRIPGKYIMVDHALARVERGLAGYLLVSGKSDPTVYHAGQESD